VNDAYIEGQGERMRDVYREIDRSKADFDMQMRLGRPAAARSGSGGTPSTLSDMACVWAALFGGLFLLYGGHLLATTSATLESLTGPGLIAVAAGAAGGALVWVALEVLKFALVVAGWVLIGVVALVGLHLLGLF